METLERGIRRRIFDCERGKEEEGETKGGWGRGKGGMIPIRKGGRRYKEIYLLGSERASPCHISS